MQLGSLFSPKNTGKQQSPTNCSQLYPTFLSDKYAQEIYPYVNSKGLGLNKVQGKTTVDFIYSISSSKQKDE